MRPEDASTEVEILGFTLNSLKMNITASDSKIEKAAALLSAMFVLDKAPARDWAKLRGLFVALEPACGKRVFLVSRAISNAVANHVRAFGWGNKKLIKKSAEMARSMSEMFAFKLWNGRRIHNSLNSISLSSVLAGDNFYLEVDSIEFREIEREKNTLVSDASDYAIFVYEEGSNKPCLLYTSPSPRDLSTSRMPSSA